MCAYHTINSFGHMVTGPYLEIYLTPASNLGYRACPPPPPPGQLFMGAKLFIGTHWMRNECILKKFWFGLCENAWFLVKFD